MQGEKSSRPDPFGQLDASFTAERKQASDCDDVLMDRVRSSPTKAGGHVHEGVEERLPCSSVEQGRKTFPAAQDQDSNECSSAHFTLVAQWVLPTLDEPISERQMQ